MKTPTYKKQVKNLLDAKYPDSLKKLLESLEKEFKPGSLIVIPRKLVSAEEQMKLLGGTSYLTESHISDAEPNTPYLLHDIEDGEENLSTSPSEAKTRIESKGRHGLTVAEGIALAVQTGVLKDHYLDLVASRYKSTLWPILYLYDDQPALNAGNGIANDGWGAPSCRERSSEFGTSELSVSRPLGNLEIAVVVNGVEYRGTITKA